MDYALIATAAPELVEDARSWALDCEWADGDTIETLPALAVLRGVDRHYDGGLRQFIMDGAA